MQIDERLHAETVTRKEERLLLFIVNTECKESIQFLQALLSFADEKLEQHFGVGLRAERHTPPFKVCNNDLLANIAMAMEHGDSIESVLAQVNLGKRQSRLAPSLASAQKGELLYRFILDRIRGSLAGT